MSAADEGRSCGCVARLLPVIINISVMLIFELWQWSLGQEVYVTVLHVFFAGTSLYLGSRFRADGGVGLLFLIWEMVETGSWVFVRSGVTLQVVTALSDLDYALSKPGFIVGFVVACAVGVLYYVIVRCLSHANWRYEFTNRGKVAILLWMTLFYLVLQGQWHLLYPFKGQTYMTTERQRAIYRMFSPTHSVKSNGKKLKSLIIIQLESFEQYRIGFYDTRWYQSTPFLNRIVNNSLTFENLTGEQVFAGWTAAGIMVTQCAMPQVVPELSWKVRSRERLSKWKKLICFPTFLQDLGYRLFILGGNIGLMGIRDFFLGRNFTFLDNKRGARHDRDAFDVVEQALPTLVNSSMPFYLRIVTEDTHWPAYTDPRCSLRGLIPNKSYSRGVKGMNCLDENLERFLRRIERLVRENDIEVVMHGDHLDYRRSGYPDRKQIVIFPFRQGGRITKNAGSLYDVPATVMDLLDLSYEPKFAFGASLFGKEIGPIPSGRDFGFIWDALHDIDDM